MISLSTIGHGSFSTAVSWSRHLCGKTLSFVLLRHVTISSYSASLNPRTRCAHHSVCHGHFLCRLWVREDHFKVHEKFAHERQRQSTQGFARTPLQQIGWTVAKLQVHLSTPGHTVVQKMGMNATFRFHVRTNLVCPRDAGNTGVGHGQWGPSE